MTSDSSRQDVPTKQTLAQPRTRASLGLRWLSALVLVPITVLITWLGGYLLAAMVAVLVVLMAFEWNRLVFGDVVRSYFIVHAGISVISIFIFAVSAPWLGVVFALAMAFLVSLWSLSKHGNAYWTFLGIVYTTLPCLGFMWIRGHPEFGLEVAISLLFVVWATDTGAYLFGRTIGGPKLAPKLSPSKTWAGLVGAIFWASVFAGGAAFFWGATPILLFAVIGAFLGLLGQIGDIAESAAKRHFNAKDTSGFIPGHGGVLDRLDGLIFAVLAVSLIMLATTQ